MRLDMTIQKAFRFTIEVEADYSSGALVFKASLVDGFISFFDTRQEHLGSGIDGCLSSIGAALDAAVRQASET